MITEYWQIDKDNPQDEIIERAAALLQRGELVAFPTETVYGLGADAYNPEAVKQIFEVKGRLPQSPLLVHVSRLEQVRHLVAAIPAIARDLMDCFWPGPLAIILPASSRVPREALGGQPGVGLRMPAHPVALALIDKAGPIAAPSANLSGRPSPVSANHVRDDLDGQIAAILDAGPTGIGLESTILDLSQAKPAIIRWGGLPREDLEQVLRCPVDKPTHSEQGYKTGKLKITLCRDMEQWRRILSGVPSGRTALVHYGEHPAPGMITGWAEYELNLKRQNTDLFTIMRDAEKRGFEMLVFAPLPADLTGLAGSLAERIKRAAGAVE